MKLRIVFCIILCSFGYYSLALSDDYIPGTGRFYAQADDSLVFIKDQLLASAVVDVITQELRAMRLDSDLFWQRYENKFETYFEPIKVKLKEKYGIKAEVEESAASNKNSVAFLNELRIKKLTMKSKYGRINGAIKSYSIKSMTRSTQFPNSRYIKLSAKVDRKLLTSIYYRFTTDNQVRHFRTLYLTANFDLKNMNWVDAGVEVESDFTQVVIDHWRKWFQENCATIDSIVIGDISLMDDLNAYMKLPDIVARNISLTAVGDSGADSKNSNKKAVFDERFYNSLWAKIDIHFKKMNEDPLLKYRNFEVDGGAVIVDLNNNDLIHFDDFEKEEHHYSYQVANKLSSNLASQTYRLPLLGLDRFYKKIQTLAPDMNYLLLHIENLSTIQELMIFNTLLLSKGSRFQINSSIREYTGHRGIIDLNFRGKHDDFALFLSSLQNSTVGNSKIIAPVSKDKPYTISLRLTDERSKMDLKSN